MSAFAIYRLPHQTDCHLMLQSDGEPEELQTAFGVSGKKGFVIAPFMIEAQHPILLLQPDVCTTFAPGDLLDAGALPWKGQIEEILAAPKQDEKPSRGSYSHYAIDFANFHSHIVEGEFSKIVLARCSYEPNTEGFSPLQLFVSACHAYPRMFVSLISASRCGTWLMATPEVLLEGHGEHWKTMSLAGTMLLREDQMNFDNPPSPNPQGTPDIAWNIKNIQEQRYVSTYITERLEQVASFIEEKGPYTMRAGNLVHLRSDFSFILPSLSKVGDLIHALYPTPAVCGLPKDAARDFIIHNEFAPRGYYSGFAGPFDPEVDTHLFVSLRCMRFVQDGCCLYAGGGLLADSDLETEWKETEDKMMTMRALLHPNETPNH